ncbi:hypothetical protein [Mycetocola zhadangensis]|uniref:AbiTii domain-containing protein n=1 Tax=Mycetocola zhadangensis TaxID=1164595 RepID=A0A3L7J153_9MICO|nr:hypothetical protein [Mycetocola zhadangensis]RLQ83965.1 hypothetical protein D9V28_06855 [Mycetocola zhadangensis]GGE97321.1 hypothetical protein GCM10011313_20440 [Mycetocola zhadangensis]
MLPASIPVERFIVVMAKTAARLLSTNQRQILRGRNVVGFRLIDEELAVRIEGAEMDSWLALAVFAVLVGVGVWRWKVVTRRTLTDVQCEEIAESTVNALFRATRAVGTSVAIPPSFWEGLSGHQAIEAARWMIGRGYVTANDWGLIGILLGSPPHHLALTQGSYDLQIAERAGGPTFVGNGHINIGGVQIVAGNSVHISARDLVDLAMAVRQDSEHLDSLERSQAHSAADTLDQAARGELAPDSPQLSGAIKWLKERADEAVGGAMGAAMWAATSTILARIFTG